jgi:hypothetical protein
MQRPLPDNTQHSQETDIHVPREIWTHNRSERPQNRALDRAATGIGFVYFLILFIYLMELVIHMHIFMFINNSVSILGYP